MSDICSRCHKEFIILANFSGKTVPDDGMCPVCRKSKFKRTTPFECKQCGLCCQGRGDLWGDEDSWPDDVEPADCTAFNPKPCTCNAYDDRRDFCREYPWDEWCQREMVEMGIYEEYLK